MVVKFTVSSMGAIPRSKVPDMTTYGLAHVLNPLLYDVRSTEYIDAFGIYLRRTRTSELERGRHKRLELIAGP